LKSSRSILQVRLRELATQLPYLPQALRLVWSAAPRHTAIWLALLLFLGMLPIAIVYLTRSLVDGLLSAVRSATPLESGRHAFLLMILMAGLLLVGEIGRVASTWVRTAQAELVQDHISGLIQAKSAGVDLAFYDNADFYDRLHRARDEAGYRPTALLESMGGLAQNGITLFSMMAVLLPFGAWLPLVLLVSTLPALYVVLRAALNRHYWRQRTTSDERRTSYYDWLLTAGETAAEIRLFGLGDHFQSAFRALRTRLRMERLVLAAQQGSAELIAGLFAFTTSGGALLWMAWKALHGLISLGDLAMLYQAFQQGMRLSRALLENVGQLYSNTLFLGNLFEFLAMQPKVVTAACPKPLDAARPTICFRNVSFRYPGTDRPALRDLDLEIPDGHITAIVGSNGAGKSTIAKLLCRFYDPDQGCVELNGIDLRSFDLEALRRSITVLFQQPTHYNATGAENIALGDVVSRPPRGDIESAAEAAGADEILRGLPSGYDQLLGRWFENGVELSVGEWQRVALARAFLRQAPILILDEPTSAMDPWAEAEWLGRFRELAAGRTAVVITHRLTTARIADTIYLLTGGHVVEHGSHEELVSAGGLYARAWLSQTRGIGRHKRR
jgi:ATP-binding cassette, subfamily B, bacterial